jgi:hypothetical protein
VSDALRLFGESLILYQKLGALWGVADCLEGIAGVLCDLGQFDPAARLMFAAATAREQRGLRLRSRDEVRQNRQRNKARAALGAARFEALTPAGQALSIEDAIAEALAVVRSPSVALAAAAVDRSR